MSSIIIVIDLLLFRLLTPEVIELHEVYQKSVEPTSH